VGSNREAVKALIQSIAGQANILAIPRVFITLTKDIKAALLLSQIVYWSDKGRDGWFYKSMAEWHDELSLTRRELERALTILEPWVTTRLARANSAPTTHYRVDMDRLTADLLALLQSRPEAAPGPGPSPICTKGANRNVQKGQNDLHETDKSDLRKRGKTLTETTNRLQQETTTESEARARAPAPNPDDLLIAVSDGGRVIQEQLDRYYGGMGRTAPKRFKSIQQRDAYAKVYQALGSELRDLAAKGLSRERASLPDLLAWLEGCSKKKATAPPGGGGRIRYYDGSEPEIQRGANQRKFTPDEETRIRAELRAIKQARQYGPLPAATLIAQQLSGRPPEPSTDVISNANTS
jgi:hypothetical protein